MTDRYDELHDERISALYRETRAVEPPAWLDRRILAAAAAAAAAVESRPVSVAPLPRRRASRWTVPLALAATLVLTVGVVRMVQETGELKAPSEMEAVRSLARPAAEADAAATGRTESLSAKRELPQAEPPATPPLPASPAIPLSAPADGAMPQVTRPIPAAPATLQSAPAKPSASKQEVPAEREGGTSEMAPARAEEKKSAAVRDRISRRSPAEWLAEIAELRRQGRTAEADASLKEFRRLYPDYPPDAETSLR